MKPRVPRCENKFPYCARSGQEMKCMKETESEYVFMCPSCEQVNIITKPEYRQSLRQQVNRERQLRG